MKNKIMNYIKKWKKRGYPKDIPDEVPEILNRLNLAPSYKAISLAILNNDVSLKSLGEQEKKSKIYSVLKKIEIENRGHKNGKKI